MKINLLLLLCLVVTKLSAQTALTEDSTSRKYLVFEENFDNNSNGWLDADDVNTNKVKTHTAEIANGCLLYGVTEGKIPLAAAPDNKIDFSKDFEIEYSFKVISAQKKTKFAATLFWGRDSLDHGSFLYFSKIGVVTFVDCSVAGFKDCFHKRSFSYPFEKGEFNKVVLRKEKEAYYLYVNDRLEKKYPYSHLLGSLIGLGAGPGSKVAYDYIKVYHLE